VITFYATRKACHVVISLALVGGLLCSSRLLAKKPGGGGGGGGGKPDSASYTIVKLDDAGGAFAAAPSGSANDINEQGNVVGTVEDILTGDYLPVFWAVEGTDSLIIPLRMNAALPEADWAFAKGVNSLNEIVGYDESGALYWSSPDAVPVELPGLWDGLPSDAQDINDDGVICGSAMEPAFDEDGHPNGVTIAAVGWRVTWPDGELHIAGPVRLPTFDDRSYADALNENDAEGRANIVGGFESANFVATVTVQWTVQSQADGTVTVTPSDVAPLEYGDAAAYGINNPGVSCGQIETQAMLWLAGEGLPLDPGDQPYTSAFDVSDAGVIVGEGGLHSLDVNALVWTSPSAQPVLLARFLPKRKSPLLALWRATAVNKSGVIAGEGGDGLKTYAFVAIPR
jgi:hypothetical protein